jgi:hypothetical protein
MARIYLHDWNFIVPQNRQVQNSGSIPDSPQAMHVHPNVLSKGRFDRQAAHSDASGSLSNVQVWHAHSSSGLGGVFFLGFFEGGRLEEL